MKILGIDFSTSQRSVALVECTEEASTVLGETTESGTRETNAFGLIDNVLQRAGVQRSSVDALALGLGPGSYGGIRVSLSLAQGWQLAVSVKTAGVESTLAIAEGTRSEGTRGRLQVIIDAQRGEFYRATFELDETHAHQIAPLKIITRSELESSMKTGDLHVGPDLESRAPAVQPRFPRATILADIAHRRGEFVSADQLRPVYIRPVEFVKAPAPRTDL